MKTENSAQKFITDMTDNGFTSVSYESAFKIHVLASRCCIFNSVYNFNLLVMYL